MKKLTTAFVTFLAALLAFTATTLAWFSMRAQVPFPTNFYGSTQAAYFAGGNGSKDEPYTISAPVHLYNLAWLQYLGYFNLKDGFNNGRAQSFFKLENSFSCNALVLPPIGTAEYPFIGNFDGNGKVLTNVTVSNYKNGDNGFSRYPDKAQFNATTNLLLSSNSSNDSEVSIVGLFGVTGNYNDFVTQKYASVTKKDSEETPAQNTAMVTETEFAYGNMQVKDFYVNNLHVNSQSEKTLVGLVAGYVRGSVNNVGVYACDMQLKKGAQGLEENSSTVSHYAIVGNYDDSKVEWEEKPIGGVQGDSAAWGGSIDMRTLNRRITYMFAAAGKVNATRLEISDDNFGLSASRVSASEYYWNRTDTSSYAFIYINDGTVLPLNVDKSKMGLDKMVLDESDEVLINKEEIKGLHCNTYYQTYTQEVISSTNTGYIVGYGKDAKSSIRARIQPLASSNDGGIYRSLGYSEAQKGYSEAQKDKSIQYNDDHKEKFEMLTIAFNADGTSYNTYRIKDDVNGSKDTTAFDSVTQKGYADLGLNGYQSVRTNFDASMENSYMIHGFHFQKALSAQTATSYETVNKNVTLCGEEKTNYSLIKGGVNFTLEQGGTIKAILGSYYTGDANSMFDLYRVERQENATGGYSIKSFQRLSKIYKDADGKLSYIYENDSSTTDTDGLTLVFDFDALTKEAVLMKNAAYYFEIPVTAGDYVMGADKESSESNAYLMYLDIGANGGNDGSDGGSTGATKPYDIASVDFVSAQADAHFAVPQKDGATYFPQYADVTFSVSSVTEKAVVKYRRAEYAADDLANAQTTPIASVLKYYCENVTLTPAYGSGGKAEEDESLKN